MPYYLKEKELAPELKTFQSVLIVPCGFCPAASFAVRYNKPYFAFMRSFLKTKVFNNYLKDVRKKLKTYGVEASIFSSVFINNDVVCLWTEKRKEKLRKKLNKYEAILVIGCEAAIVNVKSIVGDSKVKIFKGVEEEGLMTAMPKLHFPDSISLEKTDLLKVKFVD